MRRRREGVVRGLVVLALASEGCASFAASSGGYCSPPLPVTWSVEEDAPATAPDRTERLAALMGLRSALLVRRALGGALTPELRLQVLSRIEMVRGATAAISAELACEGERVDQAEEYLAGHEATTVQQLTVASVLVSAATAVASVFLATTEARSAPQDIVAIAGGTLTVGLGLGSLYVRPKIDFSHPRNLLTDVWNGPSVSALYPPPIWAYLTRPEFSNDGQESIRARIIARWRTFETLKEEPSAVALLFGAGGKYDTSALRARSAMLGQVKAEVELENQELAVLAAELLR